MPRLERLADAQADWPEFLAMVKRHRIPGLAHRALKPMTGIPEQVRQTLSGWARASILGNLSCIALLSQLDKQFSNSDIRYAVLKGIPLSQQLYGDNSVRQTRDIDLLVAPDDFETAESILLQAGLKRVEPDRELTPQLQKAWFKLRHHFSYVYPKHGITVELHWRLFDNSDIDPGPRVLQELEQVEVSPSISFPVLRRESLLPHLMMHGASHAWCRLKWLSDVAALLAGFSIDDRKNLLRQARDQGVEPAFRQAIGVCEALELLPSYDTAPASATERWLTSVALHGLLQDEPSRGNFRVRHLMLSRYLLSPRRSYRLQEFRVHAFSADDWMMFPLPQWLTFAYPLFRAPFWLIRRSLCALR
ncbi:MAG: nucleotidyltransferase family protein [Acidobacteriales bacterium]|nr:nucleotidyltransferase family protein [Terriglobales bacterium]